MKSEYIFFRNNVDKKEISWAAREIEFRYLMNNSALHPHIYELNVKIFPTEAAMMEALLEDYHRSFRCTKYIGMCLNLFYIMYLLNKFLCGGGLLSASREKL